MNFWVSEYKKYNKIPNNYLCISISKKAPYYFNKKNAVIPYEGVFNIPDILIIKDFENTYYNYVNNIIRKMGYNGFSNYLLEMENMFNNNFFHDDNDKEVKYKNIVFMYDENENNEHIPLIKKLFKNFDKEIKEFNTNIIDKSLF
jgi:hypothetical protein